MHAHTPMHVLKVIPTKHTLKLLFGLASAKYVSPLNLTVAMAMTNGNEGLMRESGKPSGIVSYSLVGMNSKNVGKTVVDSLRKLYFFKKEKGEDGRRRRRSREEEVKEESRGWKAPEV